MRADFLTSEIVDRSRACTLQYKIVRGVVAQLLITNDTTWHYKDRVTVKLRHAGGLMTIVDRVSALYLALLTDLKQGFPTTGTPDYIGDAGADGDNNDNYGFVVENAGIRVVVNTILLPLGQITLTGKDELEITVETAVQQLQGNATTLPTGRMRLSNVSGRSRVDTILCYDVSGDLESQQGNVREIYALGKQGVSFFNTKTNSLFSAPSGKDVQIKLSVDGSDSENDIETYGALTAITGQLTSAPNNLIRVFQDFESLPAYVYVKVYGDDKDMTELLYIREQAVPHMIGTSMTEAFDKEQKRIETLEHNEPERARALVQAGKIAPSETIAAVKEDFVSAVPVPAKG